MNCPSCQAENDPSLSACARCGVTLVEPTSVLVSVDLRPGTLFHSRYEIQGPLGRGKKTVAEVRAEQHAGNGESS